MYDLSSWIRLSTCSLKSRRSQSRLVSRLAASCRRSLEVSTLSPLKQIRTNAEQTTLLEECAQALRHATSRREATEIAAQFVAMLTPAKVCAYFTYQQEDDTLVCVQSAGDTAISLSGLVIKNGERTTGWAVAHDTVMANSPATLDLVDRATMFAPPLQTAIVAPLRHGGRLLGALSAYKIRVTRTMTITDTRWNESPLLFRWRCKAFRFPVVFRCALSLHGSLPPGRLRYAVPLSLEIKPLSGQA